MQYERLCGHILSEENQKGEAAMKKTPRLYHRTPAEIAAYRATPMRARLKWLEETARFFYLAKAGDAKIERRSRRQQTANPDYSRAEGKSRHDRNRVRE
jgi:hypothetical protein